MKDSRANEKAALVYSTEYGRICPVCGEKKAECVCRRREISSRWDGIVRVGRQTKGRKGKGVTLIEGLIMDRDSLKKLASRLKQLCGSGGTIKDGIIEIQGDHRDILVDEISKLGWKVKKTGG